MSASPAVTPPPGPGIGLRGRKRLDVQARLYDCAVQLFIEKGYDAVSVEQICHEAGVGRASFFRYFGAKTGLMIEFDRRVVQDIERRLAVAGPGVEARLDTVQAAIDDAWTTAHPNVRALGRDYLASTAISDMGAIAAGITEIARRIFQAGIDDGQLDTAMPADLLAGLYVTSIRIGIAHALAQPRTSRPPDATRRVLDLFLRGVARR